MITSQFILDIFDLALRDGRANEFYTKQVQFLEIIEDTHTGMGRFIYFKLNNDALIEASKIINLEDELYGFCDVEIINKKLGVAADVLLWVTDDIIDNIEIFNKVGTDYPLQEFENYEMINNQYELTIIR